jgi:CBS domain-containing protein
MQARDVMKSHPSVVLADDSIRKAARIMRDRNVGMLPVVSNLRARTLLGVLTDRDIVLRCCDDPRGLDSSVRDHMTGVSIVYADADSNVEDVADKMEGFRLRRVPVVDRAGGVIGVVALSDIRRLIKREARWLAPTPEFAGDAPRLETSLSSA